MVKRIPFRSLIWSLINVKVPLFFSISALVIIVVIWAMVFIQIESDRRGYINNAQSNLLNVARSFKEHSQNTVRNADEALRVLKYHYETKGSGDFHLLNSYFKKGVIDTEFFNQAGIIDANGQYIFSNLSNHKVLDLSDREHFKIHKEHYSYPLYLSKVVLGRASNKWSIQLTRRLEKPDGSFNGVSVVSFDPTYFINFHRKIDLGNNGFTAFLDLKGVVRTLSAGTVSTIEGLKEPLALPASVQTEANGTFISNKLYDSTTRIYAFERLSNQPLMVMVGMDLNEVLAEHTGHRKIYLMFAIGLSAVIALFAIGAIYTIRRSSRLNAELVQRTRESGLANKHKTEFLAAMSHELRTPLNGIMGYAEYIYHSAKEPLTRFPAQIIYENSQYLLNLINSLLDLTKVETGQMTLVPTQFDLEREVKEVVKVHAERARTREIDLNLQFNLPSDAQVNLDLIRFKQVLNNLLDNAIKYSDDKGAIVIRVDELEGSDQIKVSVSDRGIGIPSEKHSEVFQKFWQNEDFVTRKYPGSGLGLALCKRLIELMGGQIGFTSAPKAGSTFYFSLPIGNIKKG
jgi:two-component system, NarL family, sensor histidine kinase BarA